MANEQKSAGKKDLASFCLNRSPKALQDLIANTWKMESASDELMKQNTPRIHTIYDCVSQQCAPECEGVWLQCAREVLQNNGVQPSEFGKAVRDLLNNGRGKYRNIFICGPTNCGKTFLLRPLQLIFKTFSNPARDKYAFVGAVDSDIIFLNDFRWDREMISWADLLLLLEGQPVHFATPKNHFKEDACLLRDTPIFATGKSPKTYRGPYNARDEFEDEMMASRWKLFTFKHQIPVNEQKDLPVCPKCFATLVLS